MVDIIPIEEVIEKKFRKEKEKSKEEDTKYITLKESIIQDGEWKAYKISKKKWVNEEGEGTFLTIEKHIAKSSSLNKDEKNWWMKQSVSITYSKEIIESIIKVLSEILL